MPHTPGPWKHHQDRTAIGIYQQDDDGTCGPQVADVLTENVDKLAQAVADAKLIAAAPDLLEAAIEAADWLCETPKGSDQWERGLKLRAAIAKAKGGVA